MPESRWWWAASSYSPLGRPSRLGSWTGGPAQWHQPRPRRDPRLELHNPHARGDPEPGPPRPAWVHHRHGAVDKLEQRLVGVAVHDDLRPGKRGVQRIGGRVAELVPVGHHDREAVELELGYLREAGPQVGPIGVAVHRRNGRERRQLDQDVGPAHVPGVQDVIDVVEHLEHFWTQETMGVRDDAQPHFPSQRFTSAMSNPRWSSTRCTTKSTRSATFSGLW